MPYFNLKKRKICQAKNVVLYFGAKNWVVNSDIKGTTTKKFPFEWCRQRSIEFFFSIFQAMPILTTTYPLMNSTFNVSQHTQKLIQEKMVVASKICDRVLNGEEQWESLFKVSLVLVTFVLSLTWHRWFSGRMLACHAGGPGSIPGRCKFLFCLKAWKNLK